ncbi:MAG: hypothetical protein ACK448_02705, partial [Bacteroidota bacterium]
MFLSRKLFFYIWIILLFGIFLLNISKAQPNQGVTLSYSFTIPVYLEGSVPTIESIKIIILKSTSSTAVSPSWFTDDDSSLRWQLLEISGDQLTPNG